MQKLEFLNLEPKMLYLGVLGSHFEKPLSYLKSAPSKLPYCKVWCFVDHICQIAKSCEKIKMPKFRIKNALFGYFWARILKKTCHIWNQHPLICLIGKFCENRKMSKFGTKNALFGIFELEFLKNYCHIWNQHPQICLIGKFCEKRKYLNLGPKMSYLGFLN